MLKNRLLCLSVASILIVAYSDTSNAGPIIEEIRSLRGRFEKQQEIIKRKVGDILQTFNDRLLNYQMKSPDKGLNEYKKIADNIYQSALEEYKKENIRLLELAEEGREMYIKLVAAIEEKCRIITPACEDEFTKEPYYIYKNPYNCRVEFGEISQCIGNV